MDLLELELSLRVLVIYIGGMIGMKINDNGGLKINFFLFIYLMFFLFLYDFGFFLIFNIVNFGYVIVFF